MIKPDVPPSFTPYPTYTYPFLIPLSPHLGKITEPRPIPPPFQGNGVGLCKKPVTYTPPKQTLGIPCTMCGIPHDTPARNVTQDLTG